MLSTILYIVLPFICIIGCYTAIFLKVRKSKKVLLASFNKVEQLRTTSVSDRIRKSTEESNSQLFRMILVISACFIILIIPMMVVGMIERTISSFSELANVDKFVYCLVNANFVMNPFVYFFMNKNYREAFMQLLPEKLKDIGPKHGVGNTTNETKSTQV